MKVLNVRADWDDEASVWVVSSDDIPGLITEAPTVDEVLKKLREIVPYLLQENGLDLSNDDGPLPIEFVAHQRLDMHVD